MDRRQTTSSSTASSSTASTLTTSSSTTSSSTTPTNCPNGKTSFGGGKVAGVGIGCAIVGALLAILVFYIFMKRSKRSGGGHRRYPPRHEEVEKAFQVHEPTSVEENLLERADDSQIRKSMQDLNELIDQHVENYYHLQVVDDSQSNLERGLAECGYSNDPSVREMISLLHNPKTRFAAIRQVIAMIIVRNGDCKARADVSLLPPIASFCQAIPPVERQPGCDEVFDKAFNKWRHLSAFLLSPTRASRDSPKANGRDLQGPIARNVALINSILKPFVKSGPEMQRYQEDNLSALILEGAQLGLLLFCQPSVWLFSWKATVTEEAREKDGSRVRTTDMSTGGMGSGETLVVFPGIGERTERHGRHRVRELAAPVVVRL